MPCPTLAWLGSIFLARFTWSHLHLFGIQFEPEDLRCFLGKENAASYFELLQVFLLTLPVLEWGVQIKFHKVKTFYTKYNFKCHILAEMEDLLQKVFLKYSETAFT